MNPGEIMETLPYRLRRFHICSWLPEKQSFQIRRKISGTGFAFE
jgi:hypothetical protein